MASTAEAPQSTKRRGPKPVPLKDRILRAIEVDENGCWRWRLKVSNAGYGSMTVKRDGKTVTASAHRVAFEAFRGEIPAGLQLDHLCRVRDCVNPGHLEPVTPSENIQRSPIHPSVVNRKSNPGEPCTAEKHGTTGMRQRYGCCCIEAFEDQRKASRNYWLRKQAKKAQTTSEGDQS